MKLVFINNMNQRKTAKKEDLMLIKIMGENLRYLRNRTFNQKKYKKNPLTFRPLSQSELGLVLGVTFQQIQKYETGMNQIPITKLTLLSNFFKVPINFMCHSKMQKFPYIKTIYKEIYQLENKQ